MIKVIENKHAAAKPTKRYECDGCASVLEAGVGDLSARSADRDGAYYRLNCPLCKHVTYIAAAVVEAP